MFANINEGPELVTLSTLNPKNFKSAWSAFPANFLILFNTIPTFLNKSLKNFLTLTVKLRYMSFKLLLIFDDHLGLVRNEGRGSKHFSGIFNVLKSTHYYYIFR